MPDFGPIAHGPTRADTWEITLMVENIAIPGTNWIDYDVWDKKTGGKVDSSETKYHPGGMAPPISLGGRVDTEMVTLQRLYRIDRDHDKIDTLLNSVGKARCQVHQLPMDINGNRNGHNAIIYLGTLKSVTPPDVDSEGTDAALYEVEITIDSVPTHTL